MLLMANVFMSKWEEEEIYTKNRLELKLYKKYNGDVIILWKGSEDSLKNLLQAINANRYEISFMGNYDRDNINFLDVQIYRRGHKLDTRTYFKSMDSNGYIPG